MSAIMRSPRKRLQPLLRSPFAAWTLDGVNGGSGQNDRSGNARHLQAASTVSALRIAAPVEGMRAFASNGQYTVPSGNVDSATNPLTGAYFASTGISMTFWFLVMGHQTIPPQGGDEAHVVSFTATGAGGWLPWWYTPTPQVDNGAATNFRVHTYSPTAGDTALNIRHQVGLWQFCAFSHANSGAIIYGLDGIYDARAGIATHSASGRRLTLLGDQDTAQYQYAPAGAMFDVVLWDKPSTQTELEAQRLSALGG